MVCCLNGANIIEYLNNQPIHFLNEDKSSVEIKNARRLTVKIHG